MNKKKRKSNRRIKKKRNPFADIPIWMCIVFILFGCVLGGFFGYECLHLNKTIDREDAIIATGCFDSYEFLYSPRSGAVSEVRINFTDRDELYIGFAYHAELDDLLAALEKGDQLNMLLHPNSEDIWELTAGESVILSFDDAKSRTRFENGFFMFFLLGFCLICTIMGVVALGVKCFAYKKQKQRENTATTGRA